jgi:hypothetical protein
MLRFSLSAMLISYCLRFALENERALAADAASCCVMSEVLDFQLR